MIAVVLPVKVNSHETVSKSAVRSHSSWDTYGMKTFLLQYFQKWTCYIDVISRGSASACLLISNLELLTVIHGDRKRYSKQAFQAHLTSSVLGSRMKIQCRVVVYGEVFGRTGVHSLVSKTVNEINQMNGWWMSKLVWGFLRLHVFSKQGYLILQLLCLLVAICDFCRASISQALIVLKYALEKLARRAKSSSIRRNCRFYELLPTVDQILTWMWTLSYIRVELYRISLDTIAGIFGSTWGMDEAGRLS